MAKVYVVEFMNESKKYSFNNRETAEDFAFIQSAFFNKKYIITEEMR
jgi:hypothetical protein